MSTKTENLAFAMYRQFEAMRKARKQPVALAELEERIESYLDGLRIDHAALVDSLQHNVTLYQDAYENQKALTRNACVYDRERCDELYQLRNQVKELEYNGELEHEKLQEATAKLASQSEAVDALHAAVKDYQKLLAASQEVSANWEFHWDCAVSAREEDRKLVLEQRKHIEKLTFELASVRKQLEKRSFWMFWKGKIEKSKAPQKKMK